MSRLLTLILLFPTLAQGETVVRGPYVQNGSSDRMTVAWRTLGPSDGKVWFGSTPSTLDNVVVSEDFAFQHEVEITGLKAATRYYYAVGVKNEQLSGGTSEHYFETSPKAGDAPQMRLWVLGDSGTGAAGQYEVRDAMLKWVGVNKPDLFLHMGDMAYGSGTDLQFQFNFFAVYQELLRNTVCLPTIGNHEGKSSDSKTESGPYYDAYVLPRFGEAGGLASGTEAYYSVDYGNVHFIVLDSYESNRAVDGPMLTWLAEDLAATDGEWIIAYWHHPPYTKGSHDSDVEKSHIDMRQNAIPILEAAGVDLVLGGHSHTYERSFLIDGAYDTPTTADGKIVDDGDGRGLGDGPYTKGSGANDGTVYVVAGHGGKATAQKGVHPVMYFTEAVNGSCIIDLQGNTMTLHNIRKDGTVTDDFSIIKGKGLLVAAPNGGEKVGGGEVFPIRWASSGSISKVTIRLSTNGGDSWTVLADKIANTGKWDWDVPSKVTNKALIRVQSATDAGLADDSDVPFSIGASAPKVVLPWGSIWRYNDKAKEQPESWLGPGFNDTTWAEGPAPLGYGDDDEATLLQDYEPNAPSYYFRKTITLDAATISADLKMEYDDGIIVWVNKKEAFKKYADFGTWYSAYASDKSSDNEKSSTSWPEGGSNPFVEGVNVIAVMVKQRSAGSSDVSFDMELTVVPEPPPEPPPPVDTGDDTGDDAGEPATSDTGDTGDATTGDETTTGDFVPDDTTSGGDTGPGMSDTTGDDGAAEAPEDTATATGVAADQEPDDQAAGTSGEGEPVPGGDDDATEKAPRERGGPGCTAGSSGSGGVWVVLIATLLLLGAWPMQTPLPVPGPDGDGPKRRTRRGPARTRWPRQSRPSDTPGRRQKAPRESPQQ